MKIITLNLWGGRVKEAYQDFFNKYQDIGIWCFQEVNHGLPPHHAVQNGYEPDLNLFNNLKKYLNLHQHLFCSSMKDFYGLATFFNQEIEVVEKGEILVAKGNWEEIFDPQKRDHDRKLQYLEIRIKGRKLLLANIHCTHRPEGKMDSEKRLHQSKIICDFLLLYDCPKILVGDLNLLPETESIKMIEDLGMINLIKEYKVESTRTKLYKKPLRFADYIFVSPEIKVNEFKVLSDIVSDHSPLYLDFEI